MRLHYASPTRSITHSDSPCLFMAPSLLSPSLGPPRTYLALRVLVSVEEFFVVLLVGPAGEEEGKGGADGGDDRQDTGVIHAEHLVLGGGKGERREGQISIQCLSAKGIASKSRRVGILPFPTRAKGTHTSPVPSVAKTGEARMRGVRPARADLLVLITSVILLLVADILIAWRVRRGAVGMKPRAACMHTKRIAREKKTFILTEVGGEGSGLCHAREGRGKEGKGQGEG